MPRGQVARVADMEVRTPPVTAVEALRRNLLYAMFKGISEGDMGDIVAAQVRRAKKGDSKAARLIMDMVQAGAQGGGSVYMQQAVVVGESSPAFMSDLRKIIVHLLAFGGPHQIEKISEATHTPGNRIKEALDHHWFEQEADGWHVTNAARTDVLEK